MKHNSPSKQKENIFGVVNHLNLAIDLITGRSKRKELAELNLAAGKKAKASNAWVSIADNFDHFWQIKMTTPHLIKYPVIFQPFLTSADNFLLQA